MKTTKIIGITINIIALLLCLLACLLLGTLATIFVGSVSPSDRTLGYVGFSLILLMLAVATGSLFFAIKKSNWLFQASLVIGILETLFYIFAAGFMVSAIEAAARP